MPITSRQMATNIAHVPEFTFGDGGTVNVSYTPSRMTEGTLDTIEAIGKDMNRSMKDFTHILNEILVFLVVDWDVYDVFDADHPEKNIKTPIDDEHLRTLSIEFRVELLNHIVDHYHPNAIGPTQNESGPSSRTPMESVMEPRLGAS